MHKSTEHTNFVIS